MANEERQNKKRRRRPGVPTALVILLLLIAIAMGGVAGFMVARRSTPVDERLEKANERIIELENTLTLIGFQIGEDDPENFVYDDGGQANGTAALSGTVSKAKAEAPNVLWTEDDGLITGTLDENIEPVVVAEFDGGQLLSTEVIPEFNDQLTTQIFAGYSADEVSDSVLQSVLSSKAAEKIIALKVKSLGLDAISDEDMAAIEASADEIYGAQVAYYTAFVPQEGQTQEEIEAAARQYMADEAHVTRESIVENLKAQLPLQKYRDYVVKDITVTDEEVQKHYEEVLADQKANFIEYPEEYEFTHADGGAILYNPEGYRAVADLLIPFESTADAEKAADLISQIEALDVETDAERLQALEAELSPLYKPLETTAAQIAERLQAGEDFMALVDEFGGDEQMNSEPVRSQGYYVSDRSFLFSTEFIQGSMILDAPGQVSAPLRSPLGLHLARYLRDVAPGEVPLQDVYDAMKAEALQIRRDAYYEEQTAALLEDAHVKYYPERLQ